MQARRLRKNGNALTKRERECLASLSSCGDVIVEMFLAATNVYLREEYKSDAFTDRLLKFYLVLADDLLDGGPFVEGAMVRVPRGKRGSSYAKILKFLGKEKPVRKYANAVFLGRYEQLQGFFEETITYYQAQLKSETRSTSVHQVVFSLADENQKKKFFELFELHDALRYWGEYDFAHFDFDPPVSSGEAAYLSLFGRLHSCFKGRRNTPSNRDALLFLDEAETALHPSLQRDLVWNVVWFFESFFADAKVHVVFGSHTPLLLSDVPVRNVCFLDEGLVSAHGARCRMPLPPGETFGANVIDLYSESFALKSGTMGRFSERKLNSLLTRLAEEIEKGCSRSVQEVFSLAERQTIALLGDPVVRRYVMSYVRRMTGGGFPREGDDRSALALT